MVIDLQIDGIRYEVESLVRMLLPEDTVTVITDGTCNTEKDTIRITEEAAQHGVICKVQSHYNEINVSDEAICSDDTHSKEQTVCRLLYRQLTKLLGRSLPWGMLTGVRPVKLLRTMTEEGKSEQEIARWLSDYGVSEPRVQLCFDTWKNQKDIIQKRDPREISLYVAIPFCPTRCSYCSFVSHSIEKAGELVERYLDALLLELHCTAQLVAQYGLKIVTVYFGGGTPTSLSASQLEKLLSAIRQEFDLTACTEFTVEAGRPDTFEEEKLAVMQKYGVTRISINPQTLNDAVLQTIGRRHTAQQFFAAYQMAEKYPFEKNVDLIAGLPGDTMDSFRDSVEKVIALRPENITVHALTIKHASALKNSALQHRDALELVEYSRMALQKAGYIPYYLYRQKGTVDALENIGYTLPGHRCLYNVYIMDDSHTIISVGAGGVSKLVPPHHQRIERMFNYKYPYEYISRFETVLERKRTMPLECLIR